MRRIADNVCAARAEETWDAIKLYFENLRIKLDAVLYNNIFNYDETNLTDDPDSKAAIISFYYYHPSGHKILPKFVFILFHQQII